MARTSNHVFNKELEEFLLDLEKRGKISEDNASLMHSDFDCLIKNFDTPNLIVIGGKPSMGKTSFALEIAISRSFQSNGKIGIFSLEMNKRQIIERLCANLGRIDLSSIQTGQFDMHEMKRLISALKHLGKMDCVIEDEYDLDLSSIVKKSREMKKECTNLSMIIIDYLQLIKVARNFVENRSIEISEITRTLKSLAKELNIPIVLLSQVNRNIELRPNKRPLLNDLRDSGAIEEDADMIIFLYRDEVYNPESLCKGIAEVIIAKNRNGILGHFNMAFQPKYSKFSDLKVD